MSGISGISDAERIAQLEQECVNLKSQVEQWAKGKRPFSEAMAQQVIDGQVKEIQRLQARVAEAIHVIDELKTHTQEVWSDTTKEQVEHFLSQGKTGSWELDILRSDLARATKALLNKAGDDLCWFQHTDKGKIPPQAEFLESCKRYHAQIASERGELTGCKTIAQLEQELSKVTKERDDLLHWREHSVQ